MADITTLQKGLDTLKERGVITERSINTATGELAIWCGATDVVPDVVVSTTGMGSKLVVYTGYTALIGKTGYHALKGQPQPAEEVKPLLKVLIPALCRVWNPKWVKPAKQAS